MFEPIKFIVNRVLSGKKQRGVFNAAEICSVAEKLFKTEMPEIAERFAVKFVKGRVVHVAALTSSVAAQLRMGELTVLMELQKRYPEIRQIRYSIGALNSADEVQN